MLKRDIEKDKLYNIYYIKDKDKERCSFFKIHCKGSYGSKKSRKKKHEKAFVLSSNWTLYIKSQTMTALVSI